MMITTQHVKDHWVDTMHIMSAWDQAVVVAMSAVSEAERKHVEDKQVDLKSGGRPGSTLEFAGIC